MPTASPRPCAQPGCDQLVSSGRCPAHAIEYQRHGQKLYRSSRWAGLRRQVLTEEPWCRTPGCHNLSTDVDHIVPLRDGGAPLDRTNLQGLCHMHHAQKTAREVFGRKG